MVAPPTFVVRRPEGWLITPPGDSEPESIPVRELLAMLRAQEPAACRLYRPPADRAAPAPRLDPSTWVEPVPAFVAHACERRLHVQGNDGRDRDLDPNDILLLDAVDQPRQIADLIAQFPDVAHPNAAERVARLVEIGRLDFSSPPSHPEANTCPPDPDRHQISVSATDHGPRPEPRPPPGGPSRPESKRMRVFAPWHSEFGPPLSLGMLTAAARTHRDGALESSFEIRRPEEAASVLAELSERGGPVILLCSDYVWSVELNLALAREASTLESRLLVIHGGPSAPKYEADALRFMDEHRDVAHILVRGEGEDTLPEILENIAWEATGWDLDRLSTVAGLSFRDAEGNVRRTEDRDRIDDLDRLASPYLIGEFDHIPPEAWVICASFETNRGCPYGCTFCDWGSLTLARVRKFAMDRVRAEIDWAAHHGIRMWNLTDANFGIIARDVEVAEHIAASRTEHDLPDYLGFTVAKNTTRHLAQILDLLTASGLAAHTSLSLQTRDDETLAAVDRSNISTDHYVQLAAELRRRGIPLQGDLMLGLPGQTSSSYQEDLQFMIDHDITARTWLTQLLPNAPMNEPAHRRAHQIGVGPGNIVTHTSSFSLDDRNRMMRLRYAHTLFEHFGLLRHVFRFAQWEHGHRFMDLAAQLVDRCDRDPHAYPVINWALRYFDLYSVPPVGWPAFFAEARQFVTEELEIPSTSALDTVFAVQAFLMPEFRRPLPDRIELDHDYLAYYRDATAELFRSGAATGPERPLSSYSPGSLTIDGDPANLTEWRMRPHDDSRDEVFVRPFWVSSVFELDSPLARNLPETPLIGGWKNIREPHVDESDEAASSAAVHVRVGA